MQNWQIHDIVGWVPGTRLQDRDLHVESLLGLPSGSTPVKEQGK